MIAKEAGGAKIGTYSAVEGSRASQLEFLLYTCKYFCACWAHAHCSHNFTDNREQRLTASATYKVRRSVLRPQGHVMTALSPSGRLVKYATPYSTLSVDNGAPFVLSYPKHSFAKTWRNIDALENNRLRLKPFVPFVPWYRASLMVVRQRYRKLSEPR